LGLVVADAPVRPSEAGIEQPLIEFEGHGAGGAEEQRRVHELEVDLLAQGTLEEAVQTPGLCGGKQQICASDGKNDKYCYQKPVTTTTVVPSIIVTGYHVFTTTPTTASVPAVCPSGCSCYTPEDGKKNGLSLCGGNRNRRGGAKTQVL
jgi:hypothetical protein